MCIVVTGVPGVGKSTVMENAAKAKNMKIVNYGTVMFEIAKSKKLVNERDEMRKLPTNVQKNIQKAAAEKIHKMGNVIVDTHATIKTPRGYLPGVPYWVLQKLKPEVVVLVETDAADIAKRRTGDGSRTRDADSKELIEEHQMMNRAVAMAYATISGATVKIIMNKEGRAKEAADELIGVL